MLYLMRKHASSWLIKIILGSIVIVFVFWGVGSYKEQTANIVAEVNDVTITSEEYYDMYNRMVDNYKRQFGDRLDEKMLKSLNIKKQVVDTLIEKTLVIQEAAKLEINVTDDELSRYIQNLPYFKKDGIFDNRLYINMLRNNRTSPEQFEASQRNNLLLGKLSDIITGSAKVSDQEALEWYLWNNETRKIDFKLFETKAYTQVALTEDELNDYFKKNVDDYKTDEQRKVAYVSFKKEDYFSMVTINDERISDYYETHKDEFVEEKTVEARHILLKIDDESDEEKVEEVHKQALLIEKEARDEKNNFASLAKKYSQGPSKDDGGYLGKFKKQDMVKEFSDKAFSMKAGEISEPVRTNYGWHIIKVENVNEARELTLGAATSDIKEKLRNEDADSIAYDEAEKFSEALYEDDDIVKIAESKNITPTVTEFFTTSGPKTLMRDRYQFARYVFEMELKQISDMKTWGNGYYLIQLLEIKKPEIPIFTVVKDRVEKDLKEKRQKEMAFNDALLFYNKIKSISGSEPKPVSDTKLASDSKTLTSASSENLQYSMNTTDFFKRSGEIPEIGYEYEVSATAFQLSQSNPLPDTIIYGRQGYYVLRFNEKKQPEIQEFESEKEKVKKELVQQKQANIFQDWLNLLKSRSKISIEEQYRSEMMPFN